MKTLVVLDGNSIINRAFYALPAMTNSKAIPTGAVYGFTNMLFKIVNDIKPNYIAAAFDRKAPTFRHIEYKEYKAGRKKMPDELRVQMEPAKKLLEAFNIGIYEIDGYEADDIIGTIARKFEGEELKVIIITGDKDSLQLISENTNIYLTKKGTTDIEVCDINYLKEKFDLDAKGFIELKGLMGDKSDNIPGVPGVGEKTALKLLHQYKTIEGVYENIEAVSGKKLKENLINHREDAFLSKKLSEIDCNVPLEFNLEDMDFKGYNSDKVEKIFIELEFKSLLGKISQKIESTYEDEVVLSGIKTYTSIDDVIESVKSSGFLSVVPKKSKGEILGIIINEGYFIPSGDIYKLKDVFEDTNISKYTYGGKEVYTYILKLGISMNSLKFDAEIAAYLINPSESKYDIKSIINRYANVSGLSRYEDDSEEVLVSLIENLKGIKENMLEEIKSKGMEILFEEVEMPLVETLASMEYLGFKVNKEKLDELGKVIVSDIEKLTKDIYSMVGEEFNINSPKQLGVILFEKMDLPVIKKTKTGYSTDAEVLDELSGKHEIISKIIQFRQLSKLNSTYIEGLKSCIQDDEKIHSSFNQTITTTGRISSTEPNLQNIPIKLEMGRQIRKAFVPSDSDYVIMAADYSQIELRILAHISEDENLIYAFNNNQDIHTRTASEVFSVPMEEVTNIQRSNAKAVNFGIVYGLSDFGLSKDLKITRKEAKQYIDNYFARYQGVKTYLDNTIETAKTQGYVKTLINRVRYIPEISSSNRNVRMYGERLAMNTPIQGTAADIIKIAMVNVYARLKNEKFRSKLILQVHDELILEVHKDELEKMKLLVEEEMKNTLKLSVPLEISMNFGENWYEAK
ncbi:DNA polymerase I [Clostridium cylindrosporum]|uniref:DNA polymerase I n=1 Tax=Clostridium cylindrosporum DSM 605 TaxID=1121307 RepID=A0A0J8G1A4_CLOCY|nr:DNA polymerase I [Clostridium cylindrosporum]KMT21526.1 DNA polymerase I [Clostridium cylindrosporum DSM 605]